MQNWLLKIYRHFSKTKPIDWLEVIALTILTPLSAINFILFSFVFFSNNTIYELDPKTYEIIITATPEERVMIGNQLVAYLFLGFGWILIPLLKAIYKHTITTSTSIYLFLASIGLYSIFLKTMIPFAIILFILLIRNTELGKRISTIREHPKFKEFYGKLFPTIPD